MENATTNAPWIADRRFTDSLKWGNYNKTGVLPMWVADMDFRSAEAIIEALRKRANEGVFGYARQSEQALEAVVGWLDKRHHWKINPEWVVWMPGVVSAIHVAARAFSGPQEGIFTFTPIYPPFLWSPQSSGRRTVTCPLQLTESGYQIDFDLFEETLTPDTKVLLLCSPHNPVGRVWTREELMRVAEICLRRKVLICSDEIHCDLLMGPNVRHIPTATLSQEIAEHTVTLMSAAKSFNLPGLNCGFAVISNPTLRRQFQEAAKGIVPHVNIFGYTATQAAYADGSAWFEEVLEYLRANQDLLYHAVNEEMQPLSMIKAEATYLAWIDCRGLEQDNPRALFEKAGVGVMDGTAFGQKGFVRLNFACSREHLMTAVERMKKAIHYHTNV
ncbi:MAG: PatB family C-S lyase [Planctomycetaceae bacterium]|nr:PatB family C-S lyase [Planctomycetaceae bacterium]